ncbi:hypothetical protein FOQG_19160 [Fusarium oxysporum f. sp. raphani 54005]|uniref:Uncharacterized protein n=3 Tax=Fusarium oxysporum TaxID=5507 RepID=X0BB84_FUSOX|nr:hypothetical protein FOVG_10145 [Fusarium oxysporum f. sp. pisi HDV247]EXK25673.1 hypothetical protein FOMG_17680 [Fusarium oxysporum f. sp. melonis 26406]EXK76083.1 hypothetical protein FOQG_19160 [Fusarium oxysporum f. sp. raphani 54005]
MPMLSYEHLVELLVYFGLPSCNHQSIVVDPVMITLLAGAPRLPRVLFYRRTTTYYIPRNVNSIVVPELLRQGYEITDRSDT